MKKYFFLALLTILDSSALLAQYQSTSQPGAQSTLCLPSIPTALSDPAQRAAYLVEHYWDRCQLQDPTLLNVEAQKGRLEQFFVDFIYVMPHSSQAAQKNGVKRLFTRASQSTAMYLHLLTLAEKYLYEPNSPVANEDLYIHFLRQVLSDKVLSDTEKIRPRSHLTSAQKNRPGTLATDFRFLLMDGRSTRMSANLGKEQTLLIFYNSECEHCEEILTLLRQSPYLTAQVRSGALRVLAICLTGATTIWKQHRATLPSQWLVGYALPDFEEHELYSIRAFPTLYLLNSERKVILKDPQAPQLLEYITKEGNR